MMLGARWALAGVEGCERYPQKAGAVSVVVRVREANLPSSVNSWSVNKSTSHPDKAQGGHP